MSESKTRQEMLAEFVKLWQSCDSAEEVAAKLKKTPSFARGRASVLRKAGVPLKKMERKGRAKGTGEVIDYEYLKSLAISESPEEQAQEREMEQLLDDLTKE